MRVFRFILAGLCAGVCLPLDAVDTPPEAPSSQRAEAVLKVAAHPSCFVHSEKSAALLTPKLLANHLRTHLNTPVEPVSFDSAELLEDALKSGGVQVVALMGDALVRGWQAGWVLEPVLMSGGGKAGQHNQGEWMLLAPKTTTASAAAAGRIVLVEGGQGDLPALWLEQWRRTQAGGRALSAPLREPNAGVAIIRTFLGKADACLAPVAAFYQANAANPEIVERLRPVAATPAWPGIVICLAGSAESLPKELRSAVENLAGSPHGQALTQLWQADGLRPFEPRLLPEMQRVTAPAAAPVLPNAAARHPSPSRKR